MKNKFILLFFVFFIISVCYGYNIKVLDKGFVLYDFQGTYKGYGYHVYVLKIDPSKYSLQLLMASKLNISPMSLRAWAERYGLIAVINASMFWEDKRTSTGFMKSKDYINQKLIHKKFGGFFVFNPKVSGVPYATIVEKRNNWKELISKYENVIQNYRMIGKNGKNLWHKDTREYSVSAIAIDKKKNIQFIFSYNPVPIHELCEILLNLPLDISSCLFTEGGGTCGLYIKYGNFEVNLRGQPKMDLFSMGDKYPEIPNVIGVVKRNF